MPSNSATERFEMVKKHHGQRFIAAVDRHKADLRTVSLCRFLNQHSDFFTASSCAGRIMLLNVDSFEQKQIASFLFKQHTMVKAEKAWAQLQKKTRKEVWLKQEPFILHLGARNLECANKLLACARHAGIKRGGIMLAKPGKFILELQGTQNMSVPVKQNSNILVNQNYFGFLIRRANQKLKKNALHLQIFEKEVRKKLEK